MNLSDAAPAMPYALAFLAGMAPGWALGRVDWLLSTRYWRDLANRNRRYTPHPPSPSAPAVAAQPEPITTTTDTRMEDAA